MFVGHICLYSHQIIPVVLDKVLEAMRPQVDKIVNDRLQPYIETIEHTKTTVLAQETVIQFHYRFTFRWRRRDRLTGHHSLGKLKYC
jgi:hypothetical protein